MSEELEQDRMIDRLAERIVELAAHRRTIPLSIDLWDVETIALLMKRDPNTVRTRIVCLPTFPKAIRLPSESGTQGRPLWKAAEVLRWVDTYQAGEKRAKVKPAS